MKELSIAFSKLNFLEMIFICFIMTSITVFNQQLILKIKNFLKNK